MRDVRVHLAVDRSGLELATYRLSAAAAFPWLAGSWSPRGAAGEVSVTWGRSHLPTPLCPGRWAFPESFLAAFRGKPAATRGSPLYSQSRLHLLTRDPLHFSMYISSEIPNTFAFHDIAPDSISWELVFRELKRPRASTTVKRLEWQRNPKTNRIMDSVRTRFVSMLV